MQQVAVAIQLGGFDYLHLLFIVLSITRPVITQLILDHEFLLRRSDTGKV